MKLTEADELLKLIGSKHEKEPNRSEKIILKWLGWIMYFLSMSTAERVLFAEDAHEIRETVKQFTKDLHELRRRATESTSHH